MRGALPIGTLSYWFGPASVNVRIATQSGAATAPPFEGVTVRRPKYWPLAALLAASTVTLSVADWPAPSVTEDGETDATTPVLAPTVTAALAVKVWLALPTFVSVTAIVFDCPDSGSILRKDSVAGSSTALVAVAAARLITPPPMFCGLVVPSRASRVAVSTSALLTIAGVQSGCSCTSSADEPATCGVAMLVPWNISNPPCRTDEYTFTPGAQTSGLISSRLAGPRLEKPARKFWLFVRTSRSVAPFAVAFCPASARIAARSARPTITPEIVGWFAVPSCAIAVGSPATLFTTTAPTAPALCALRIFVENVQVPRSSTTMLPAKGVPVTATQALVAPAESAGLFQFARGAVTAGLKLPKSPTAAPNVVAATMIGTPKK